MNEESVTITPIEPIGSGTRLREAPSTRFSGSQHVFDLVELSAHLLNEDRPGANGHRQITIFRHDATTMVLFTFEVGGQLTDHKANGLVTIHALDGALTVEAQEGAEWQRHDLRAQQILVLNPGVLHNVTAHEAGRMLLTIQLVKNTPALQR